MHVNQNILTCSSVYLDTRPCVSTGIFLFYPQSLYAEQVLEFYTPMLVAIFHKLLLLHRTYHICLQLYRMIQNTSDYTLSIHQENSSNLFCFYNKRTHKNRGTHPTVSSNLRQENIGMRFCNQTRIHDYQTHDRG